MQQSIFILGRQPKLGIAELESLYGAEKLEVISSQAVKLDLNSDQINFNRLGGSIKLADHLAEIDSTRWVDIINYLKDYLPSFLNQLPEGKLKLGISLYDLNADIQTINRSMLDLKKLIKSNGRSVRVIQNNTKTLNSAQVLYNQLTSELGWEILLVRSGNKTILARTIKEQDIDAYSMRDQNRPKRDAKVGMLPPKLAQIIINLATKNKLPPSTILDPFCGTGVILQEALLMGYSAYGTDIEPRMIEYSQTNIDWLKGLTDIKENVALAVKDAMTDKWDQPYTFVASETYLGRPLSSVPPTETLEKIIQDCNHIHKKFLENLSQQIPSGTSICLAVPAWRINNKIFRLQVIDHLEELGYTEASFVHVNKQDLIYYREDQFVARELVVLNKV